MSSASARVRRSPAWLVRALLGVALISTPACHRDAPAGGGTPATSSSVSGALPADLSVRVLAKVGDRTITLGDYVAVLDGMDRIERARYQTPDRREQLLKELVDVELLSKEAERRGLADRPEARELERQILRDEVLAEIRSKQPPLEQIPAGDVRAYYDSHRADFKEPERRRISHIVVRDAVTAEHVLASARGTTAKQWGELVRKSSLEKPAADLPDELVGDLGLVTPPSFGKNDNARVPEPLRAAAFEIEKAGDVLGHVVQSSGFHVLRLTAESAARDRSLEDADRTIRVLIAQQHLHTAEATFEKELRARFPVKIDEAALAKIAVPAPEGKK
ncbi:MAG TPA: peptidyl-prolyl cis-trans isomerase [Polyangiaceae bacterium]|jgi:parvulin-like peptidyl-prolyl isomerase|nr:peptidyl-prolyl cis-trans isomerase [Polyangiaceae bacterium]